jgi:mRNA interferase HigB
MWVISKRRLREFWELHPESAKPLMAWYKIAKKAEWTSFGDIKRFAAASADTFGQCVIFNIGGNKYRLVVRVHYNIHRVYVMGVYTHEEYDEDRWKCEC